ncbi:hypothetical protein ACRQ1B_28670 [Rhizobium panacihumi]|uniref:hypothetical protein n=1 Tax=Rhizobium panacihumi TaxID=2008450 RepID=UPI003D7991D5
MVTPSRRSSAKLNSFLRPGRNVCRAPVLACFMAVKMMSFSMVCCANLAADRFQQPCGFSTSLRSLRDAKNGRTPLH